MNSPSHSLSIQIDCDLSKTLRISIHIIDDMYRKHVFSIHVERILTGESMRGDTQ